MRGKLIVLEGTDCSGKETQTRLLTARLKEENIKAEHFCYPNYASPTGKIVGGPYLGREDICKGWFPEGASHVDPKIASLYYAADRRYNIDKIKDLLDHGVHVIVDRYVYSNMAHQGGKLKTKKEREALWDFLELLEFGFLELPKPDIAIFLFMPLSEIMILKQNRRALDEHETDSKHLENALQAYLELASRYPFHTISCAEDGIRSTGEIHEELYQYIKEKLC